MSLAELACFITAEPDFDTRWRLVVEFLKEYHQEPKGTRQRLLTDVPESTGDERWDVLFAGLAEHLATRDGKDAPGWAASRGLRRFWFPFDPPGGAPRRWSTPRPRCAGAACSSLTTRSTPRERFLAAARPRGHRGGLPSSWRPAGQAWRGNPTDLYVFGGAAMALAYDSRRATRDVDALFKPHGIVLEEALAAAAELGLPRWWLNEQASSWVAPDGDSAATRAFYHPGLRVFAASPEHLLAMKALAARPRTRKTSGSLCRCSACTLSIRSSPRYARSFPKRHRQRGSGSSWRTSSPFRTGDHRIWCSRSEMCCYNRHGGVSLRSHI